ncbi:MAG: TetR/AcrR family transcriptional regulator [Pseudomonadota bacterium]
MPPEAQAKDKPERPTAARELDSLAALQEFARRGFRKTTIVSLADAMGVARQTLYNHFNNKETVLEWAIRSLIAELRGDALERFATAKPVGEVLLGVFVAWLGPIVALLRAGPYSEEVLGLSRQIRQPTNADPLQHMRGAVRDYLFAQRVRTHKTDADDLSLLLIYAAKGLMMRCETESEFKTKMRQLIRAAIDTPHH